MKPIFYQNARPNWWARARAFLSLSYWAYLWIKRNAAKSGKPYAIVALPASAAKLWTKEMTEQDYERAINATVPPMFQRPADIRHSPEISYHDTRTEEERKLDAQRDYVQSRIDARKETAEDTMRRVAEKVEGRRHT